ncbi:MAG: hypothetical protein MJZ38_02770 [archaeon]|nr:hypothetical protein [archaeon]
MDRRGVMGFPLRLGLAFTLLALCLPLLTTLAGDFQADVSGNGMHGEVERITRAADRVFYGGPGSTCVVDVTVAPGFSIVIGGDGADAYSISITRDGVETEKIYLEHPQVRFIGDARSIDSTSSLRITCVDNPHYGVEVTAA